MPTTVETSLFTLADRMAEIRERKDALKQEMESIQLELDSAEGELARAMTDNELQNFVRGGRQFYLKTDLHVSTASGKGPSLVAYLKSAGAGDIVQETVHPSTLKGWIKEQIDESGSLPDDVAALVNVFEKLGVGIRKAVQKGA